MWTALMIASTASMAFTKIESHDRWFYGEASNYCMAFFRQSSTQLVIRFSAKTGDDTLQIWRKGFRSLTKGMNQQEKEAAARRAYGLQLIIGDRQVPLTNQTGDLDPKNVPGIAYVLGVDERSFIEALANSPSIEIRHNGATVATYDVDDHSILASRLSACVMSH